MRLFIIGFACITAISIFSCTEKNRNSSQQGNNDIPVALQENQKSSLSEIKKREPEDILEELYREFKKEDTSLQQLSDNIATLQKQKRDSTEVFQKFDSKNDDYYNSAKLHYNRIGDSLLHKRIKVLIETSLVEYDRRAAMNENLLKLLEKRKATLDDIEEAVKIITTLSVIERYQQGNFPPAASLEAIVQEYDNAINKANILIKK